MTTQKGKFVGLALIALIVALLLLVTRSVRAEINKPSFDCRSQALTAVQNVF